MTVVHETEKTNRTVWLVLGAIVVAIVIGAAFVVNSGNKAATAKALADAAALNATQAVQNAQIQQTTDDRNVAAVQAVQQAQTAATLSAAEQTSQQAAQTAQIAAQRAQLAADAAFRAGSTSGSVNQGAPPQQ